MNRVFWGRVGCVVFCLVFWGFLLWAVSPASGATSPGQDLADDTAEWIGQTMKVPPNYRQVLPIDGQIHVNGIEAVGVVWCESPHQTSVRSDIYDSWNAMAVSGMVNYTAAMVVFHELAHRVFSACDFDPYHEEGIVQAITFDLFPAWCRRFFVICEPLNLAVYEKEVAYIRHQSARAVGAGWKTRAARLWRRAFYLSERDARRAMLPPTRGGSL